MFILVVVWYFQVLFVILFFFFKQKTAYEMRISDWSSDVCSSDLWDCTLEERKGPYLAVRLGFRQVRSLANVHGAAIVGARGAMPFDCIEAVWRRSGVPRAAIERIAEADGFACLAEDRRQGVWKVRGLGEAPLPLFSAADAREASFSPEGLEPETRLRPMTEGREVIEDYRSEEHTSELQSLMRLSYAVFCLKKK